MGGREGEREGGREGGREEGGRTQTQIKADIAILEYQQY